MKYLSQEAISIIGNRVVKVTYCGERKIHAICVDRPEKIVICFPSQMGCIGKCIFCKSSKVDYIRNLTISEMVDLCNISVSKMDDINEKPILFSCMGEGDPLCNIERVLFTMNYLQNSFPNSRFALSTSVPSKNIFRNLLHILPFLSFPVKIQISLHSVVEEIRKKMMPHSILVKDILEVIKESKYEKIELNFVLFKGINDSLFHAEKIVRILDRRYKIKINKFNNFPESKLQESSIKDQFVSFLKNNGMSVEEYITDESPLKSGCGIVTSELMD